MMTTCLCIIFLYIKYEHQPGVYVPHRAPFLVSSVIFWMNAQAPITSLDKDLHIKRIHIDQTNPILAAKYRTSPRLCMFLLLSIF